MLTVTFLPSQNDRKKVLRPFDFSHDHTPPPVPNLCACGAPGSRSFEDHGCPLLNGRSHFISSYPHEYDKITGGCFEAHARKTPSMLSCCFKTLHWWRYRCLKSEFMRFRVGFKDLLTQSAAPTKYVWFVVREMLLHRWVTKSYIITQQRISFTAISLCIFLP